jgi:nucleoid-associated protein YgaU
LKIPQTTDKLLLSITLSFLMGIFMLCAPGITRGQEEEETYSISLEKTAGADREIYEVDGKKVITESYSVVKGDHVWNILRQRGLLNRNLNETLSVLKKLNSSLTNLDLIYPEDNIIIPLVISPVDGGGFPGEGKEATVASLEEIKGIENYIVRPGDSLIKVVQNLYDIPQKELYDEYLDKLKMLNPSIKDINTIYPGQKIRIPIYSPQIVRLPIEPSTPAEKAKKDRDELKLIGRRLGEVFSLIGEEWLQSGEHVIPLKSGGQINLNVDSYPIISLRSGKRIILDLYNDLPEDLAGLITSSWYNYGIVHLRDDEDLKDAMERIIILCDYRKIQGINEPLILAGDIPLRITADWIIQLTAEQSAEEQNIVIVNLCDDDGSVTPATIRRYLERLGVRTVDYPASQEGVEKTAEAPEILETDDDRSSIMENLLGLFGLTFSRDTEIPIYEKRQADFNFIVKADYLLKIDGKDAVIDIKGLGPDIIALLNEHQYQVLSLANESPSAIVKKTLDFLGIESEPGPHPFLAADRDESKNIRLMIPGIVFKDNKGQSIFATHLTLFPEIISFLSQKGYRILRLPLT